MKTLIKGVLLVCFIQTPILSQESLEVEGAIIIADSKAAVPDSGTIQWDGSDFVGWNGMSWISLTGTQKQGSIGNNLVQDVDGNVYRTVEIGSQNWMAENLRTTRYQDGTLIPYIGKSEVWVQLKTREEPGFTWYDFDESHKWPYGGLYNWYSVDTDLLCPTGWHVPSVAEWEVMSMYLGGDPTSGGSLKATGTLTSQDGLWDSPNTGAVNISGFSAIPSGSYFGSFTGKGSFSGYWTTSEVDINRSWRKSFHYDVTTNSEEESSKYGGFNIRCLEN